MTLFVNDTFTDTNDVTIGSHTGELGATWTESAAGSNATLDPKIASNALVAGESSATNAIWLASGTPPSADYIVRGYVDTVSGLRAGYMGICGRFIVASGNGYALAIEFSTGNVACFRFDSGGAYIEATKAMGGGIGADVYMLELEFSSTTVTGKVQRASDSYWLDGVDSSWSATEVVAVTGTAAEYTAEGKVGVFFSTGPANASLTRIEGDDGAAPSGPTIGSQPTAQTANEPATATFTVSATTSGGTLHYQWKRADPGSGTFSNVGTDSNSYTTGATSAASDHGASYKVDVTDDNGTTVSDTVVLTVRSTTTVARPSADVSATGWTASSGSDLFAMIDESSASDADYITSPTITGSTAPATFTLAYPLNTGSWTLSVRAKTSTGTATLRLYLLNDANTVVGTSGDQTITSSFTTYQLAVTSSGPATRARVEIVS